MRSQLVEETQQGRRFLLVFQQGDDVLGTVRAFAREHGIEGASITALGALERATIAYWDWESKEYQDHAVDQQVEVASLVGNVAVAPDGEDLKVHAHVVLGLADGSAKAGHLRSGTVRPTLEMFLHETRGPLRRHQDEATGLALLRPD